MDFGTILKKVRQSKEMSQEELAKRVNTSRSNIANYEVGKNMPSVEMLNKLSGVLNVSTDYLLGKENEINSKYSNPDMYEIPVVGKIRAGEPILAVENIEKKMPLFAAMAHNNRPEELFYLKVDGESMNKTIPNHSLALIRKQDYAENGDIVVAIINGDDEATLKRFKRIDDNLVALEPDSTFSEFETRYINLKNTEFRIIGKVLSYTKDVI